MLEVSIDKKNNTMTISGLIYDANGRPSSSGKTKILSTTGGAQAVSLDGKVISVSVNVYTK
jgi:hypothetical protein